MIQWREGRVVRERGRWAGAVELEVAVVGAPPGTATRPGETRSGRWPTPRSWASPGSATRVLLNTTALEAGLGTGGYALVVAVPGPAAGRPARRARAPGQGPLHAAAGQVLGVDEQGSPHHDAAPRRRRPRRHARRGRRPALVAARGASPASAPRRPGARVAYVMTDGGALPAWFSRTVAGLRDAGWLAACVTVGQAFGGDLEAVTRALRACSRPGSSPGRTSLSSPRARATSGTGTPVGLLGRRRRARRSTRPAVLGGRPVAALRVSRGGPAGAPPRRVAPLPDGARPGGARAGRRRRAGAARGLRRPGALAGGGARPRRAAPAGARWTSSGLRAALETSPVRLSTMGRGLGDDEAAFLAAAAAGRHAAPSLAGRSSKCL